MDSEEILLEVKMDTGKVASELRSVMSTMADLKKEQAALKKEIDAGADATGELTAAYAQNEDTIKSLTAKQKALSGQLNTTNTSTDQLGDSFRELDAQCRALENQYKSLTKAQRESAEGQALKEKVIEAKQALKDFDAELGNHQRNVGNYPKTVTALIPGFDKFEGLLGKLGMSFEDLGKDATSALKGIGQGMGNLGKQAMSLLANPIIAAVAAALVVLKMLYDALQRNEEAQLAWQKSMAPLKAIWQNFQRVFDDIIKLMNKVTNAFGANGKFLELYMRAYLLPFNVVIGAVRLAIVQLEQTFNIWSKVFKAGFDAVKGVVQSSPLSPYFEKVKIVIDKAKAAVDDFINKVKETSDAIKNSAVGQFLGLDEYTEAVKGVVLANQELIESNKQIAEAEDAIQDKRIANIRADADAQKEIAELKAKIADKENYTAEERIAMLEQAGAKEEEIAKRALELAKAQYEAEKLKNSLTESNADDLEREAQAYAAMVAAEEALANKQKEINTQKNAILQEQKAQREKAIQEEQKAAALRLEIARKVEDALIALDTDAVSREVNSTRVAGEREIENLRIKMEQLKKTDLEARENLQKLIEAKERETQQKIDKILLEAAQQRADALRANALTEQELLTSDALQLAQFRKEQAEQALQELLAMTKEEQQLMYANEEAYNAAVLAAKKTLSDETLAIQQEMYSRQQQAEENEYQRSIQGLEDNAVAMTTAELAYAEKKHEELVNMDAETKAILYKSEEEYQAAVIASEKRILDAKKKSVAEQRKMAMANAKAIGDAMGALSDALGQFGEENKAAAKASKAIALGKVAVDTGVAIAGGIAQAQSVPFPANIAAIATTIATILANIGTAISTIKEAQFATGGIVGGTSYTGDKVIAGLNSREMVLNTDQQTRLFDAINGQGDGSLGINYEMMAAAVAAQPAPVVVYKELQDFGDKVSTYEEIASI